MCDVPVWRNENILFNFNFSLPSDLNVEIPVQYTVPISDPVLTL